MQHRRSWEERETKGKKEMENLVIPTIFYRPFFFLMSEQFHVKLEWFGEKTVWCLRVTPKLKAPSAGKGDLPMRNAASASPRWSRWTWSMGGGRRGAGS